MYQEEFLALVETLSEVEDHESRQVVVDRARLRGIHLRHKDMLTEREERKLAQDTRKLTLLAEYTHT